MANIRFYIRGKKNPSPVLVRFTNGRKCSFYIKSGYFCNPNYFNNSTGKVRQIAEFTEKHTLQNNLTDLESDVSKSLNRTTSFTKEWLQKEINIHHGIIEYGDRLKLTDLIDKYIDYKEYSSNIEVTKSTIKSYKITLFRVKEFQKYQGKDYFIDEVDSDFKENIIKWFKSVQHYQPITYQKSIKQLKTICRYAKRKGINVDESFFIDEEKSGKPQQKKEEKFPVLSIEEINKLLKFQGAEYLENARDWLVISCWTGCRVSDLMNLTKEKILLTIEGTKAINYTQIKTGVTVEIPIHHDVQNILDKRNGFPRPISHQKYNDYIKDVCKGAKLTEVIEGSRMDSETKRKVKGLYPKHELITSHIGRRSFATNHYGELSNFKIMRITGHTTERQFLEYIGKKDSKHHTDFYNYWNSQKEESKSKNIG